jgi:hypothetical protein
MSSTASLPRKSLNGDLAPRLDLHLQLVTFQKSHPDEWVRFGLIDEHVGMIKWKGRWNAFELPIPFLFLLLPIMFVLIGGLIQLFRSVLN